MRAARLRQAIRNGMPIVGKMAALLYNAPFYNPLKKGRIMSQEENKIKVNDLPEDKKEQTEETELPVINNEEKRGGHSEGGCCGACGG